MKTKRKLNPALFSSKRDDWETPDWLLERCLGILRDRFGSQATFDIDLCASETNARCNLFYSKQRPFICEDPVELAGMHAFMNPPYGRGIGDLIENAHCPSLASLTMILPARTDTKWFQRLLLLRNEEVPPRFEFLPGRVKFCLNGVAQGPAPFPTVIVHL